MTAETYVAQASYYETCAWDGTGAGRVQEPVRVQGPGRGSEMGGDSNLGEIVFNLNY